MNTTRAKIGTEEWAKACVEGRAVYCGRACPRSKETLAHETSPFANPWSVPASGRPTKPHHVATKAEAIDNYRKWMGDELIAPNGQTFPRHLLPTLEDMCLGCFCDENEPCHCDPLIEAVKALAAMKAVVWKLPARSAMQLYDESNRLYEQAAEMRKRAGVLALDAARLIPVKDNYDEQEKRIIAFAAGIAGEIGKHGERERLLNRLNPLRKYRFSKE